MSLQTNTSSWLRPRNVVVALVVLILLTAIVGRRARVASPSLGQPAPSSPSQPSQAGTPSANGYFVILGTDLTKIGQLSQTIDQSCNTNFPPPEPCASNIQTYRQVLLSTQADLATVNAPPAFQQADTTARSALTMDLQATAQALAALQAKNLGQWLKALAQHAQAGQQLAAADTQASNVVR